MKFKMKNLVSGFHAFDIAKWNQQSLRIYFKIYISLQENEKTKYLKEKLS